MRLAGKVAIISGAASGLGASAARIFAREGAKVVVADRLAEDGAAVVAAITTAGGSARFDPLDVTSEADWARVAAAAQQHLGTPTILVNNAGVSGSNPDRLDMATFDQQMNVNVRGVFVGMGTLIASMQKAGGGSIVNT